MKTRIGRHHLLSAAALVLATAAVLLLMGREPICTCGTIRLWHSAVNSAENSQHLADWYTLSHVVHGLIFFWVTRLALPRLSVGARLCVAVAVEAAWEIAENTPAMIDRYRDATIALGYTGDSVLNSVADIGWMLLGFLLASRMPAWGALAVALLLEGVALVAIRDNLSLNILMLITPSDAIRTWQAAAQ
ncbi:hypothetical protein GGR88_002211 [Sphingomonas jejuensis]|uniref:Uncharacterized protein n=1 Tax=Sphingomonas jejuensis TaxID=904715 RepID=A0ABX0XPQ1_9SPHN|nr:DUF2585 domain-containing protein [Sphingomonas jejuensis]NJC34697.1 hypothetical protein [Sphingomonas jejuensis]